MSVPKTVYFRSTAAKSISRWHIRRDKPTSLGLERFPGYVHAYCGSGRVPPALADLADFTPKSVSVCYLCRRLFARHRSTG